MQHSFVFLSKPTYVPAHRVHVEFSTTPTHATYHEWSTLCAAGPTFASASQHTAAN